MKKIIALAIMLFSLLCFSASAYSEATTLSLYEFTCTIPDGFSSEPTNEGYLYKKGHQIVAFTAFSDFDVPKIPEYFSENKAYEAIAKVSAEYMDLESVDDVKVWKNKNGLYVASAEYVQNSVFMKATLVYGVKDVVVLAFANMSENVFSDLDPIIDTIETTIQMLDINMVDLSALSYDELIALKDRINLAIWNSEEWQEVEVPKGVWLIGEDIPAGKWTIKCASDVSEIYVKWCDKLDKSGMDIDHRGDISEYVLIDNPNGRHYVKGDCTEVTWDMKEGQYLIVDEGIALFTPYAGKPSLGFK